MGGGVLAAAFLGKLRMALEGHRKGSAEVYALVSTPLQGNLEMDGLCQFA